MTCDIGESNLFRQSKILLQKLSVGGTVAVHVGQREFRVTEVTSIERCHPNDGVTTIGIGRNTLTELRPTRCAIRCAPSVAIWSGKVRTSYPAVSTRHRRSRDLGAGISTNALDPITHLLLPDPSDARSTVQFRERFLEWSAT